MNKRIQELMPKPWTFPYPDRELYTKEQFEKFAELIVKECADKCLEMAYVNPGPHHYAAMIKEHFGVKE